METLRKYHQFIDCIHIADSPGRGEPGTGCINYRAVLEDLKRLDFQGMVTFELVPRTTSETALKAINAVREGL